MVMLMWDVEDPERMKSYREGYWIDKNDKEIHISKMPTKYLRSVYHWMKKSEFEQWNRHEVRPGTNYMDFDDWMKRGPYYRIYPLVEKELEDREASLLTDNQIKIIELEKKIEVLEQELHQFRWAIIN